MQFETLSGGERRGAPTSRTWSLVSEAGAGARQAPTELIFLTNKYTILCIWATTLII